MTEELKFNKPLLVAAKKDHQRIESLFEQNGETAIRCVNWQSPRSRGLSVSNVARKEKIMNAHAEHAKSPATIRVVELVGVSSKSWSDAAQQVVANASSRLRHITGLDVLHSSAVVRDGKIMEYHVNVKVAFVVEPANIDA